MARKRPKENSDESKVTVKLKPFMGMEPGVYLTLLYVFILIVILFLVFMLPGIRRHGSWLDVNSTPAGAAIYIDGRYLGATPKTVFAVAGTHELSVRKPFYTPHAESITVGARLVGSLFFPRTEHLNVALTISNLSDLLSNAFHDSSKWALVDRVVPNYQFPPILADTVAGALQSTGFSDRSELREFLVSSMGNVDNDYLLRDFLAAAAAYAGGGGVLTPEAVLDAVSDFAKLSAGHPDLPLWVVHSLPQAAQKETVKTQWYAGIQSAYHARISSFHEKRGGAAANPVAVDGIRFIPVPAGQYLMGAAAGAKPTGVDPNVISLPHPRQVSGFYMMDTEVTHAEFARFVGENPKWAPDRADALAKAGLATDQYLKDWSSTPTDFPQAYVSFYAAQAFCRWLQTQLPAYLAGYSVRLPSETEWEWAARMNVNPSKAVFLDVAQSARPVRSGGADSLGIYDLLGNLWEWTGDWYYPAAYFLTSTDGSSSLSPGGFDDGAEVAVRGGSWASEPANVTYTTRGSQPPQWCTPFLGLRAVIVKG